MKSSTVTCLMILCFCGILLRASSAQRRPCCTPPQWEGFNSQKTGSYDSVHGTPSAQDFEITYHVDFTNKKVASEEKVTSGSQTKYYNILMDYQKEIMYSVHEDVCTKVNISGPMASPCVPPSAIFMGSRNFAGVEADTWMYQNNTPHVGNVTTRITLTQKDCTPIHSSSVILGPVSMMHTTRFFNITIGIKDPHVFDVPAACESINPRLMPPKPHQRLRLRDRVLRHLNFMS